MCVCVCVCVCVEGGGERVRYMCLGNDDIVFFTIDLDLVDCTLKLFMKCSDLLWYVCILYIFLCKAI